MILSNIIKQDIGLGTPFGVNQLRIGYTTDFYKGRFALILNKGDDTPELVNPEIGHCVAYNEDYHQLIYFPLSFTIKIDDSHFGHEVTFSPDVEDDKILYMSADRKVIEVDSSAFYAQCDSSNPSLGYYFNPHLFTILADLSDIEGCFDFFIGGRNTYHVNDNIWEMYLNFPNGNLTLFPSIQTRIC